MEYISLLNIFKQRIETDETNFLMKKASHNSPKAKSQTKEVVFFSFVLHVIYAFNTYLVEKILRKDFKILK